MWGCFEWQGSTPKFASKKNEQFIEWPEGAGLKNKWISPDLHVKTSNSAAETVTCTALFLKKKKMYVVNC